MARAVEQPVTVADDDRPYKTGATKTTHPAFGQIVASRVSGRAVLYGSDFIHQNYITITINTSELHRNLSNDWHFARGQVIEVALSEAQWATFVSAMNQGSGVPCTIEWLRGEGMIPGLPEPESRSEQFSEEFIKDFDKALEGVTELVAQLEAAGLSKKKTEDLIKKATSIRNIITSAAPYVVDQFSEHMEQEKEKAKVEIHGYATSLFQRAGVEALTGGVAPLALPGDQPKAIEG